MSRFPGTLKKKKIIQFAIFNAARKKRKRKPLFSNIQKSKLFLWIRLQNYSEVTKFNFQQVRS